MGVLGKTLADGSKLGPMYAEGVLNGVTQENYARFARPGGEVMHSNHPAFVLGHLSLYPVKAMALLERPPGATQIPEQYEKLFNAGVDCQDDPDGTIYPPLAELRTKFFDAYAAALSATAEAEDDLLSRVNPNEGRSREMFPTIGAAICFYLGGHVQMHLGQISAWRRAMGMGPAM